MDDRNKDLTHLFVRDLDEIPLPPRGDWRAAGGRRTGAERAARALLAAGAVAAVLAVRALPRVPIEQRPQGAAGAGAPPPPPQNPPALIGPRARATTRAPPI